MPYTTLNFYRHEYHGSDINEATFENLLKHAERKIDSITYYRIKKQEYDKFSDFDKEQISLATCAQIEHFQENGGTTEKAFESVQSVSIGRASISKGNNNQRSGQTSSNQISSSVYEYLAPTGLLYAGIGAK
ncbi:hypothetical protein [Bacillus cereus]|uniref:Uncharacterized protein n=1 Tax=Bacillus cereus TaxID=1396 RepID=A0A9X7BFT8_BACCE|nr:hypothetical protein [Bacillus cereus]PED41963.1 hypothetical protein CON26_20870 [Bacillus cereus]PFV11221.1 hypothetical protein COK98_02825 [Bacillus cereus]